MEHQEEFDHIFREYYAQLFVFARRFIDDIDDCHDLVNDVYEDVWLHFHDIRQEAVRTYLYTNLRHKCVDFLRRFVEHMKYAEAAEQLHVSLSTIKKHIVRALKLIRESRGGQDG